MDIRKLKEMPFDKVFHIAEDRPELCHATGYEVFICGAWWNEYIDSNGDYHYGR